MRKNESTYEKIYNSHTENKFESLNKMNAVITEITKFVVKNNRRQNFFQIVFMENFKNYLSLLVNKPNTL